MSVSNLFKTRLDTLAAHCTLLGPWRKQAGSTDLGCIANSSNPTPAEQGSLPLTAIASPGQGCNYKGARAASVSRAQQNFVVPIVTSSGTTEYIWTGDRWMQAADGKKAHEPQYWVCGRFLLSSH